MSFGKLKDWQEDLQKAPLGNIAAFVVSSSGVVYEGILSTWEEFTREINYDGNAVTYKRSMFTTYGHNYPVNLLDKEISKWRLT